MVSVDVISHNVVCRFQMQSKLYTPSFGNKPTKNAKEGGYQKVLATYGLNAPIFQQTKAWLKQHKEVAKC